MQELASHSYSSCAQHMGCVLPPLVNISLDQIVLDELHLLLRIMDVLIRNLILYAGSIDHRQWVRHGIENQSLRKLEQVIRSYGVCFQIWQNKEPTGKPIPGSFDWTPLSGKHKLQVLKSIPAKMDMIFEESTAPSVVKLWNVSENYCMCSYHNNLMVFSFWATSMQLSLVINCNLCIDQPCM